MNCKVWLKARGGILGRLLALVGSVASLVGLLVQFLPKPDLLPWWAIAILIFAAFSLLLLLWLEFISLRNHRVYSKSDQSGIKKYMHDLILHGGRVAIWTRDMSWAQNPETRKLLKAKAKDKELILCLPKHNKLSIELEKGGAEICTYGVDRLESPTSRFTIACFGRDGARVAVGRADGDSHVIDEFKSGNHPAYHLAEDLISLVRAICQKQ